MSPLPYVYRWSRQGRKGQPCEVLARGKARNSSNDLGLNRGSYKFFASFLRSEPPVQCSFARDLRADVLRPRSVGPHLIETDQCLEHVQDGAVSPGAKVKPDRRGPIASAHLNAPYKGRRLLSDLRRESRGRHHGSPHTEYVASTSEPRGGLQPRNGDVLNAHPILSDMVRHRFSDLVTTLAAANLCAVRTRGRQFAVAAFGVVRHLLPAGRTGKPRPGVDPKYVSRPHGFDPFNVLRQQRGAFGKVPVSGACR